MRRRAAPLVVLLAVALLLCSQPTHAATTPAGYGGRLDAALAAVRQAARLGGAARGRAIDHARALLPAAIILGGVSIRPDFGAIRRDLAAGHLAAATARLAALRTALAAPSARVTRPDRPRLAALDQILRNPPFVGPQTPWDAVARFLRHSPLGAAFNAISRFLHALFDAAGDPVAAGLPYLAGLIVAVALIFAAANLLHPFVPQAQLAAEDLAAAPGVRIDAAGARARATALAATGDYREGVRYLFLATLLTLDETGRLRIDAATGNRDVLRQARAAPHLFEALTPVVRLFDLFWFGHALVTRAEYEHYQQINEHVLQVPR